MTRQPTIDFDHHSEAYLADRLSQWRKLRESPVAYSPRYGGFWVVSGHAEVAEVSRDEETFSSRIGDHDGITHYGIAGIPRIGGLPAAGIAEAEAPIHQALRRVLNPDLLPQAVNARRPFMEDLANWFIDQKITSGAMDLVLDLANPVPAVMTMDLVGLPHDSWDRYAELFHGTIAYRPGTPEYDAALSRQPAVMTELMGAAKERRVSPRNDLLTRLAEMEVDDGRQLTDDEISAVLRNLVAGGLDTTTSLTALALFHLDAEPELRRALGERPELIGTATEEFLRYYSVSEVLTRTVTRDVDLGGRRLYRGDIVLISWLSANHDESEFHQADQVILDRTPNRHLAFGVGPHRCIGMHLARALFQVLLETVLRRMPDYRVDRGATRFYEGNPMLAGVVSMPATFTPGPRQGPAERPF